MIPGHFKAYTVWLLLLLTLIVYLITGRFVSVIGVAVIIIGSFFGDQATHLAQADHSALPPTAIERWQQKHRVLAVGGSFVLAAAGAVMAFNPALLTKGAQTVRSVFGL